MSRIINYSYTDTGLLKQIAREGEVMEIIRPEDEATSLDAGSIQVDKAGTQLKSNGLEIQIEAGANGVVKKVTDASGKVVHTAYNKNQQPIKIHSGEQCLLLEYDEDGNLIKRKNEKNNSVELFEYADNRLVKYKDGEGHYFLWEYEENKMISKKSLTYKKDENGDFLKDKDGNKIEDIKEIEQRKYNDDGMLTDIISNENYNVTYAYDQYGNVSEIKNESQELITNDSAGNPVKREIGENIKEYLYDSYNRVTEVSENGVATKYKYDTFKRLIEILQSNNRSAFFDYDVQDRLIEKKDVKGNTWKYDYNSAGHLHKTTKPNGQVIEYTYDAHGNPVKISAGTDEIVQEFDLNNKIIRSKNSLVDIKREYDITGLLTEESMLVGEVKKSTGYRYNKAGQCTSIEIDGHKIEYGFDARGVMNEVSAEPFHLGLGNSSQKLPTQFVNEKFTINKSVDGHNELSTKVENNTNTQFNQMLSYDVEGNCVSKNIENFESWSFKYNSKHELARAQLLSHSENISYDKVFTYDDVGNRIKENNFELIYDDFGYQLQEDQSFTYAYDDNGNLAKKVNKQNGEIQNFEYNMFDQLAVFRKTSADGQLLFQAQYGYDGFGRRVMKEVNDLTNLENSKKKWYQHDLKNLLAEYDEEFGLIKYYIGIRSTDHLLGYVQDEQPYYFVKGKFNTIDLILDQEGKVKARYTYGPYGELLYEDSSVDNDLLYIGREYDRELAAYMLRARHYDPGTGRFFQIDPDAGELFNPRSILLKYAYANNNPLRYFDPYGTKLEWYEWLGYGLLAAILVISGLGLIGIGGLIAFAGAFSFSAGLISLGATFVYIGLAVLAVGLILTIWLTIELIDEIWGDEPDTSEIQHNVSPSMQLA